MHFNIVHTTTYTYPQAVVLGPHVLRLRPRSTAEQQVLNFALAIDPQPPGINPILDTDGNATVRCWWPEMTLTTLQVTATSEVLTLCTNPFNFLLESGATHFPLDYPSSLQAMLHPYVYQDRDTIATQLAQKIALDVDGNVLEFLTTLNQQIHQNCKYQIRETGQPFPPWMTWAQKQGTCRDFVMLFIAACRGMGLAARFVSGYEAGDPDHEQALHAWAEVYLPGAGWRGYDPTMGLVVCDRHVALVASAWPQHTTPIVGGLNGRASQPTLTYTVNVHSISI